MRRCFIWKINLWGLNPQETLTLHEVNPVPITPNDCSPSMYYVTIISDVCHANNLDNNQICTRIKAGTLTRIDLILSKPMTDPSPIHGTSSRPPPKPWQNFNFAGFLQANILIVRVNSSADMHRWYPWICCTILLHGSIHFPILWASYDIALCV